MIRERPFNCSNLFLITVSENSFSWAKENSAFPAEAIVELSFRPPLWRWRNLFSKEHRISQSRTPSK